MSKGEFNLPRREIIDEDRSIQDNIEQIFSQIFSPYFDFNQTGLNQSLAINPFNNAIITWEQFEDAINNNSQETQEKTSVTLLR